MDFAPGILASLSRLPKPDVLLYNIYDEHAQEIVDNLQEDTARTTTPSLTPFHFPSLTFNTAHQISQYDATFRYFPWAFQTLLQTAQSSTGTNSTAFQEGVTLKLATSVCSIATTSCTGANQQYANQQECLDFLTKEVRFGNPWELGMDTLLCRMVHQGMVPLRPEVHCSHVGKSGGGYCNDDRKYTDVVAGRFFEESFVGGGFPGDGEV
ncbi:MAG: hypothetical protein Q9162_004811 [Coniocarpon cinnabarinum]